MRHVKSSSFTDDWHVDRNTLRLRFASMAGTDSLSCKLRETPPSSLNVTEHPSGRSYIYRIRGADYRDVAVAAAAAARPT